MSMVLSPNRRHAATGSDRLANINWPRVVTFLLLSLFWAIVAVLAARLFSAL